MISMLDLFEVLPTLNFEATKFFTKIFGTTKMIPPERRRCRKALPRALSGNAVAVDPESRRLRKVEETYRRKGMQMAALDVLLRLRAANCGKSKYGHVPFVASKYRKMGYTFVTRGSLL
jgi:hypothetical protein